MLEKTICNKRNIISVQSRLVFGHVGNNIAEMAISMHGLDIIAFPTVLFSTHTGFTPVYGSAISKNLFEDLIKGIEAIGVLDNAFGMITGYIASTDIIDSTVSFVEDLQLKYPDLPYICDPVMGDNGGLYVKEEVASKVINELIPLSQIITPNQFEFEYIVGRKANSVADILECIDAHPIIKDKTIVITGCQLSDTPDAIIETLIVQNKTVKRISSPRIDVSMVGTGDFFGAILISQLAKQNTLEGAVQYASDSVSKALQYAIENNFSEMNSECILNVLNRK